MYYKSISEMWIIVIILGISAAQVTAGLPTNVTRTESNSNRDGGGVCKADYGSRFNIDSKELGTTCIAKSSPGNPALSAKLKQAINRMKQDFEQLQDLIDQEVSFDESKQDMGSIWTNGGDLRVHREYPNEQNTLSADKLSLMPDSPQSNSYLRPDITRDEINFINRPIIKSHRIFESSRTDEFPYENISKLKNDNFRLSKNQFNSRNPIETIDFNKNPDIHIRDPFARQAYETRRVLADIRIDPEIHEDKKDLDSESSNSASSNQNQEANTS